MHYKPAYTCDSPYMPGHLLTNMLVNVYQMWSISSEWTINHSTYCHMTSAAMYCLSLLIPHFTTKKLSANIAAITHHKNGFDANLSFYSHMSNKGVWIPGQFITTHIYILSNEGNGKYRQCMKSADVNVIINSYGERPVPHHPILIRVYVSCRL